MTETNISTARVPQVTVIDPRIPEKAKLRVAAYARVSSDSEDQVNSYIAQVDFYSKHIAGKEDWEMVDIYADEGISGLEARNRDDFNRMMADCREGKIDRVLCKSISRFARNTQEYIQFVRELLRLGISIHFEKENIDTGKMTSEQVAQIYGAFAQMESTNHSSNMRFSVRMRMEKGLFVPSSVPYGYRLAGRDLEIIPEEAEVVRRIFSAYLSGQGKDDIARELNQIGVDRGRNREKWHPSIVLLETMKSADREHRVFKLQFAVGEFDMVIYDEKENCCEIFEIKHSGKQVPAQYRHLLDQEKCDKTEQRFGPIRGRYVLYRGEDVALENGVHYRNVERYLNDLPELNIAPAQEAGIEQTGPVL